MNLKKISIIFFSTYTSFCVSMENEKQDKDSLLIPTRNAIEKKAVDRAVSEGFSTECIYEGIQIYRETIEHNPVLKDIQFRIDDNGIIMNNHLHN